MALALTLTAAAPAAAGPEVVFGEPDATGTFGQTITFTTTFESSEAPHSGSPQSRKSLSCHMVVLRVQALGHFFQRFGPWSGPGITSNDPPS